MAARKKTALKIYDLRVELEEIEPLIWRRILVPGQITLPQLHDLLQLVMGWTNSHLHSFEVGERTFGMDGTDLEELNMLNEKKFTLDAVLGDSIREFLYEYDFGDSWRHRVTITPIAKPRTDWSYPLCVAGARAAPPEDVGGVGGYEEFLSAIEDPKHEEHDRMLEWVGGAFDPAGFDLNEINRTLRIGPRPYGKSNADR
ncbi:MAG: plasmid pRiA4b ORF-3 family protein [Steroidobacteraceae bacterium]